MTSDEKIAIEKKVLTERVRLLHDRLPLSIPINFLCASVVFAGLYLIAGEGKFIYWYLAVILVSIIRFAFLIWYRHSPQSEKFHLTLFIIGTCLSALLWGIVDSMLIPAENTRRQLLIIVVAAGVTAGGLQTLQGSLTASYAFICLIILPLIVWLFLHKEYPYILLAIAMSLYFIFMLAIARSGFKLITETFRLRFRNVALIKNLSRVNVQLGITNKSLKESENRFHSAFDFAAIGMALVSPKGYFLKVNKPFCQLVGYSEKELLHMDFPAITYPPDFNIDSHLVTKILDGKISSFRVEKRFVCKNEAIVWVLMNVSLLRDANEKPLYFIAQFQNIDIQKKAEDQLKKIAYQDYLTGVANRNKLEILFEQELKTAKRNHQGIAVCFLDLDHFKEINDLLGHDVGDEFLAIIAKRIEHSIRATDILARFGGDEFIIVITQIDKLGIIPELLKKIIETVAKPVTIEDKELSITASIGVSVFPDDGQILQSLLKNADIALYKAKAAGRNRIEYYSAVGKS